LRIPIKQFGLAPAIALIGMLILAACAAPTGSQPAPTISVGAAQGASPAQSSPAPSNGSPAPASSNGPAIPSTPTKLTVAYSETFMGILPVWMAQDGGYFQKHGLDVDLQFIASSNAVSALLANQVQITSGGGSEAVSANSTGADLVSVATTIGIYPYVFEVRPEIRNVDDLRGKKIGVSAHGSSSDIASRVVLKRLGLDPDKDVNVVTVGSAQNRTAALLNGAIDAGLDQPPGSLIEEAAGLHQLVDVAGLNLPTPNNTTLVQRSYLNANHDVVQRYVDAITEAVAAAHKDRAKSIEVLGKWLQNTDPTAMGAAYDFYLKVGGSPPYPAVDQFNDAVETLAVDNPAVKSVDISKMIDRSLVDSAVQRGLDK
jgi:NitT/TauT family transport system substrate-binding protein